MNKYSAFRKAHTIVSTNLRASVDGRRTRANQIKAAEKAGAHMIPRRAFATEIAYS